MSKKPPEIPITKKLAGVSVSEFKSKYDPDEEIKHLRDVVRVLEAEREQYEKERGGLKSLFRDLLEQVEALSPPAIEYKKPKGSKVISPVAYVSHWTDWHEGGVQDPDEIEGFNAFDPQILRARLRNCIDNQLEWVELHRTNYTINESFDLVTGDLISGGIHQELLWTNQYPEPVQAIKAGELLAEVISRKAPFFDRVVVHFVTVDNHARLTKKPQAGEAGLNTWNYIVGAFAKERLRDHKNVEFNIYPMIQKCVEVGGRRYLLTHGDRVRGWAGFPYYGLERKVAREAVKRMKRRLAEFDRVILGHWHAPLAHPHYWIGGSASGTTAYDHGEGREADPIQTSWLVHPKYAEFDRTDWILRGE